MKYEIKFAFYPNLMEGCTMNNMVKLSEQGSTRATRYAQSNKIVTLDGKTHVAWLDAGSKTMIRTYDANIERWSESVHLGTGRDNHGGPALTCDSQGYLHILFGTHHNPFQHCRSRRPNDSSDWIAVGEVAQRATYPSVVCDDSGMLHFIYRRSFGAEPWRLMYQRKPKESAWSEPVEIAAAPGKGYAHFHSVITIANDQSLHIAYNIYHNGRAKCAGHLMSRDRGNTWTLADGSKVELPTVTTSDVFFRNTEEALKVWAVVCDQAGRPWISIQDNAIGQTELLHWNGQEWEGIKPAERIVGASEIDAIGVEGCLTIDTKDCLYLAAYHEDDLVVLKTEDNGMSFEVCAVVPRADGERIMGPNLERPTGHNSVDNPWLIFYRGDRGTDCIGEGILNDVYGFRLEK